MKGLLSLLGLLALATTVIADEALFRNITYQYKSQVRSQLATHTSGCNSYKVGVRKEWGSLSRRQRLDYIRAVKCLQRKEPKRRDLIPGSRSRYDDFAGVHIFQTFDIHFNGVFLPWHRYFVWKWEKALREECGYRGYQPYWEWSKYSDDPASSPLFDGSDTSLSGNGESVPHDDITAVLPRTNLTVFIPAGPGGGCIQDGPFKDMKVNLGPSKYSAPAFGPAVGSGSGLDYNPRCLKRDINPFFSRERLSYGAITDLLTKPANYLDFTGALGRTGPHPSGHQTVGGIMDDQFESAGDPSFYLHHAQVDRMWSIWQSLDPETRQNQLQGTLTWFNIPPSRNITSDDPIGLWFEAEAKAAGELTNTIEHDFCYIYE